MTGGSVWDDIEGVDPPTDPVYQPGDNPQTPATGAPAARRRQQPKGNTKRHQAAEARRQALQEATGRAMPEPDEWRETLAQGHRGQAAAQLSVKRPTHNSESGFGLA